MDIAVRKSRLAGAGMTEYQRLVLKLLRWILYEICAMKRDYRDRPVYFPGEQEAIEEAEGLLRQ